MCTAWVDVCSQGCVLVFRRVGLAGRVTKFFQKAPVAVLQERGVVNEAGQVMVDSGLVYFSTEATQLLLNVAQVCACGVPSVAMSQHAVTLVLLVPCRTESGARGMHVPRC